MAEFADPFHDSSLWTAYSYASAQQPTSSLSQEPTFTLPTENDSATAVGQLKRRTSIDVFAPYYQEAGDGLGFDSYLDPAVLVQPPQPSPSSSSSHLHLPSPGLPPLSSADSTPSSSSALHTPYGPFDSSPPSAVGPGGLLLPSAPIAETSSSSRFAKLQESYLEQQQQQYEPLVSISGEEELQQHSFPVEPSSHALAFSSSAPPLTPTRRDNFPSSTQLWRSPSSHSVNSSPSKSPYAHRAKPYDRPLDLSPTKLDFDSPSKTIVRRNFPTSQLEDIQLSPTKGGGRRQRANLSIDVPSKYGLRSRLPVIAASPQVPSTDNGRFPGVQQTVDVPDVELTESTLQQVENLLQEFGPMARSGIFDDGSSSQSSSSLSSFGPSRGPSSVASNDTRYCISGVALSLEDMAQLDDPALTAAFDSVTMQQYPASAPPQQTSFNLPEPPSPSPYHLTVPNSLHTTPLPTPSPSYVHDSSYSTQEPLFERWSPTSHAAARNNGPYGSHIRSISAPRTAYYPTESDLASLPLQPPISHSLAQTYSTHSLPSHSSPPRGGGPQVIRRRSSIASGSPSTSSPWAQGPPRPQQTFHSYSYGPPPDHASSSSSPQHSPYHNIPLPLRPAPPPGTHFDVSPPSSPTKPRGAKSKAQTMPTPGGTPMKVVQTSPKKRKGGPRARNPSAMFVNFSAADAVSSSFFISGESDSLTLVFHTLQKKLLSGVAPSGSSKKKREEEEAAAAAAAKGLTGMPQPLQSTTPPQELAAPAS